MDASTTTRSKYFQPAAIGGVVMGVLSALPIVGAANFCCCLWVVTGGLVAAYLMQQNQPAPLTPGDGALVGLLSGVMGALVVFLVSVPVSLVFGPFERAMIERVLTSAGSLPPEVREALENQLDQRAASGFAGQLLFRIASGIIFACVFLIIGSIFSTLGGLLGAAIFARRAAPPVESQ